jgi:hypothetical protein
MKLALKLSLAGVITGCHVDVIGSRDMTATAMGETSARIGLYAKSKGQLPPDLTVLPVRQGFMNQTTDGWNRPLVYKIEGDTFSISSFGRDGVAGGAGDDEDMTRNYQLTNGEVTEVAQLKSEKR